MWNEIFPTARKGSDAACGLPAALRAFDEYRVSFMPRVDAGRRGDRIRSDGRFVPREGRQSID